MDCGNCGREYPYYYDKCPYCGAANADPRKSQQQSQAAGNNYQQNYNRNYNVQQNNGQQYNRQNYDYGYQQPVYRNDNRGYEPVSIGSWIGVWLLSCIPIVGFIMLIVWACGGTRKQSLKNWARAQFIILLILILTAAIVGVIMYATGADFNKVFNIRYY